MIAGLLINLSSQSRSGTRGHGIKKQQQANGPQGRGKTRGARPTAASQRTPRAWQCAWRKANSSKPTGPKGVAMRVAQGQQQQANGPQGRGNARGARPTA